MFTGRRRRGRPKKSEQEKKQQSTGPSVETDQTSSAAEGLLILSNTGMVIPGHVAQSVTCLATDGHLTADPGVASLIPARSHTFVEIDREIIATVILLPSPESFKMGCCQ